MSFTRFHDDECRIRKQLETQTYMGRYMLDKPGNGVDMPFVADPYMRLQEWGANWDSRAIEIDGNLRGLGRKLDRDCMISNAMKIRQPTQYQVSTTSTQQSRATHPAWETRDLEQNHRYILPLDPQENTCMSFQNNLNSRILEKDYFLLKQDNEMMMK